MENARSHASRLTQGFLADTGVQIVKQSPYSPDLNLCDRFLFRKIKSELNGVDLTDQDDARKSVQHIFRHISEDFLVCQLLKLRDHAIRVIESGGRYLPE